MRVLRGRYHVSGFVHGYVDHLLGLCFEWSHIESRAVYLYGVFSGVGAHAHFRHSGAVYSYSACRYHLLGGTARSHTRPGEYLLQALPLMCGFRLRPRMAATLTPYGWSARAWATGSGSALSAPIPCRCWPAGSGLVRGGSPRARMPLCLPWPAPAGAALAGSGPAGSTHANRRSATLHGAAYTHWPLARPAFRCRRPAPGGATSTHSRSASGRADASRSPAGATFALRCPAPAGATFIPHLSAPAGPAAPAHSCLIALLLSLFSGRQAPLRAG